MLCLFRMYELKSGSIWIDGVDTSHVGLHTLRKRLAMYRSFTHFLSSVLPPPSLISSKCSIPQDPVVFSGTIRDNLDPFNEYTTQELENALNDVHLGTFASKLDYTVAEYGDNLSVGQCQVGLSFCLLLCRRVSELYILVDVQLLCIARALLRRPKIILMDEATSSIDPVTDSLIQRTVAEKFANATVITIAHRLNTIMARLRGLLVYGCALWLLMHRPVCSQDANRIMVLKGGKIVEFDSPRKLLEAKGLFASMHTSMLDSGKSAGAQAATH
jgi:ABC-type multidrug transport system fused ATPase/permease subunit